MNPNIEVIANDFWGVKFAWVKAGYIRELADEKPFTAFDDPFGVITSKGVLVLNKDWDKYDDVKEVYKNTILPLSNNKLKQHIRELQARKDNEVFAASIALMKMELKRRAVKAGKR